VDLGLERSRRSMELLLPVGLLEGVSVGLFDGHYGGVESPASA